MRSDDDPAAKFPPARAGPLDARAQGGAGDRADLHVALLPAV